MFNRHWNNGFAFGLTVGVIGIIFVDLLFETYPNEVFAPATDGQQGNDLPLQGGRWWLINRIVYMDDTLAQWLMTFLTLIAVVLVYLTLRDTRAMAAETTRIGEAQVRAYVTFKIDTVKFQTLESLGNGDVEAEVILSGKLSNDGQSPAFNSTTKIFLAPVPRNHRQSVAETRFMDPGMSASAIPAGRSVNHTIKYKTQANIETLQSGETLMFFILGVDYTDVFGRRQEDEYVSGFIQNILSHNPTIIWSRFELEE